jgi:flagellar biosynthetic protein FlhB
MSEAQEKQHAPTQHRLQQAIQQGSFARSTQLNSLLFCCGAIALFVMFGGGLWQQTQLIVSERIAGSTLVSPEELTRQASQLGWQVARLLGPLLLMLMVVAYLSQAWQSGFKLFPQRLGFDMNRIQPTRGWQRLMSWKNLMQTGLSLLRMLVVLIAGLLLLWIMLPSLCKLSFLPEIELGQSAKEIAAWVIGGGMLIMLLFAIIDHLYQRHAFDAEHRLSEQELRDEMKSIEGNPELRARRKRKHQALRKTSFNPDVDE